jgi:hypothetical protein
VLALASPIRLRRSPRSSHFDQEVTMKQQTSRAILALTAAVALCGAAHAQSGGMTHKETVKKANQMIDESKKMKGDGGPPACSLITRADVTKARGRDPYVDGEQMPFAGGSLCELGGVQLMVFNGPDSMKRFEQLLVSFKQDKQPRKNVNGFGDRAFTLVSNPTNSYQRENPSAFLVAQRGPVTLALSAEAGTGKPVETTEPVLSSLMKTVLARLP